MLRKNKKIIALVVTALSITTAFTGCKDKTDNNSVGTSTSNSSTVSYPIKTDVKLKYWMDIGANTGSIVKNYGETEIAKELTKRTGINIEWSHPVIGQQKEQFNLMLASGGPPDIVEWDWAGAFPGGPEKALNDAYIIKLNDTLSKYAPNLMKKYKDHPDWEKAAKTDSGTFYSFPFFRGDAYLQVYHGAVIRKDWLDDLGLQVPTTLDEWTTMLKAFKDKKNAAAPFSWTPGLDNYGGSIVGAFGVKPGLYVDNGKIKFGNIEPGYKQYLEFMKKWYDQGLLDKNFATVDSKIMDANMTGDKTGATFANVGGGIGKWAPVLSGKNPNAKLVGAPYPTLKKGETPEFGGKDLVYTGLSAVITKNCKNVEIAARFLDYGYSAEGEMLFNFGIEGASYKMVNNYPTYTDLIMKNPDKLAPAVIMGKYIRGNGAGPFVQRKEYMEQYASLTEQKDAINTWMKTNVDKHLIPRISLTSEESSEAANLKNQLDTYSSEMYMKFVMGIEPLDNFDKYVQQLKKLGVERYVQINQAALDRYNKR